MNCLDSTFLIDFVDATRPRHDASRAWMEEHEDEPMYASTFAIWEVIRGAARRHGAEGIDDVRAELEWLTPLPISPAVASEAATIEAELREDGEEINYADNLIAGTARDAGATIVTADTDFERVRGLDVDRYATAE